MAISYVGGQVAGRAGVASSASVDFALTGGTNAKPQPGDLVIITPVVGSQARTPAQAISGYTALGQLNANGTTYDTSLNVSWKEMGALADTSFTLPSTGNTADAQHYTVQVFRGVDVSGIASVSASGTATGRPNPGSITPTVAGSVVVICGGGAAATGAAYTAPANFATNFLTGFTADTNDAMVGSGYWTGWTSGAVDPAAYTGGTTNAADSWAAYTIVLPPAADVARDPVTYVDSTSSGDNTLGVSFVSATAPTMIADDWDIILTSSGHLAGSGAAPTLLTPAGFDPREIGPSVPVVGAAVNTRAHIFQRKASGAGSAATLATTGGTNAAIVYTRLSYRGCDPTVPIRQALFGNGASSTSQVLSALLAAQNSQLLTYLSLGGAQNVTPPGSMTERQDNATYGVSSADETVSVAGSTGTRTFTLGSAADSAWAFLELQGVESSSGDPTGTLSVTESGPDTFKASDGKLYLVGLTTAPAEPPTSIDEKTILAPSGVEAGHREVMLCAVGSLAPAATPVFEELDGWDMEQSDGTHVIGEGVFNLRMAMFTRIADGPASNAVVSADAPGYWGWHRFALANPNADFVAKVIFGDLASTTTAPVLPGFTPAKSNAMRIDWHVLGELVGISPASGMTEWSENLDHGLGLYSQQLADTSPTGTRTYTYTPEADAAYITLEFHSLVSQAATSQGALNASESGSDTAALSGVVVVAGSLTATESGSDTSALAGTVLVSGALTVSEVDSDTAAITGSQVATGSLSATEAGNDSASIAGTVLVEGALSGSEVGGDSAGISGKVLVQGAVVVSEAGADAAVLSGLVLVQGTASATETSADVFAATGSLSGGITGSLSAAESGSDAFASTGAIVVAGALTAAEGGADSAAVAGEIVVQGALSVAESGSDTLLAMGSAPAAITGFMEAIEQGADGASMSGAILVAGLFNAVEVGSDTASFVGTEDLPETFPLAGMTQGWPLSSMQQTYPLG